MKATGIVRRIDDLGRVVIPKEIRRTMRIREGAPLEIYTDGEGEVIFKKYSPMGEMSPFAAQYAEVLVKGTAMPVLICDRDHCIAAAGISKKEMLERRVSPQLEEIMEARKSYILKQGDIKKVNPLEGIDRTAGVIMPIISAGDIMGAVIMLEPENEQTIPGESDIKLAQVAAAFLGKQMEE
ncbi:MAG TPA: AbrB/MazE/SpoVT family DNA-binding domain-containing protein [Firmicutes bacterium]|nr:AbrB/MazE/SpoVT family DNA-binding domain-containing protein [Bacillota bacterium]